MEGSEAMAKPSVKQPNIVFITADQWRHDAFGFAGNPVVQTPHADALAARGIRFRNAHCDSPVCQSSRASLVTGQPVHRHGLWDNSITRWSGRKHFPQPYAFETFPRRLQQAGYYTACIGKLHFTPLPGPRSPDWPEMDARTRQLVFQAIKDFDRTQHVRGRMAWLAEYGFDHLIEEVDKQQMLKGVQTGYTDYLDQRGFLEQWLGRTFSSGQQALVEPEILDANDTLDAFIGRRAQDFISSYAADRPFFLWLNPVGPHPPFDPPAEDARRYDPGAMTLSGDESLPIPANRYGEFVGSTTGRVIRDWDDEHKRLLVARYYAKCTEVDRSIGKLISALETQGLLENTWIVLGSDHGEMLGDHGLMGKSTFYRSAVKVPALVVPPRGQARTAGEDEYGPVRNLDLTATILELAGANLRGHAGTSLLPRVLGEKAGYEATFSEIAGFCMVTTSQWKLVVDGRTGEPQQLFDLETDPEERNDLCGRPGTITTVKQLIKQHLEPFYNGAMNQITFPDPDK